MNDLASRRGFLLAAGLAGTVAGLPVQGATQ